MTAAATPKRYSAWPPGPWASQLSQSYFDEMGKVCDELLSGMSQANRDNGYFDYIKCRNVFGRMEICETTVMRWLREAIPDMATKNVLEIGCGTGSATAPLALSSRHVYAFDLDGRTSAIAKRRCELMGLHNVTTYAQDVTWTARFVSDTKSVCEWPVDIVMSYALMEHLLPVERIQLLAGAWEALPVGGYFVVVEAPNRLSPFDWHSLMQPFTELPDELYFMWNAFSDRPTVERDMIARRLEDLPNMNRERSYRFGRGVSFHEFHIALGPDAYEVVSSMDRKTIAKYDQTFVDALTAELAKLVPPVHGGFAYPSLDLVVRKTGKARLAPT